MIQQKGGLFMLKQKDKELIGMLENHLRNYPSYKVGIANLKKRMEYEYSPPTTTHYGLREGSTGTLTITSTTEKTALKRMELGEKVKLYQLFVDSISYAVELLPEDEKQFVQLRYFKKQSISRISMEIGYSLRSVHRIKQRALYQLLISLAHLVVDPAI